MQSGERDAWGARLEAQQNKPQSGVGLRSGSPDGLPSWQAGQQSFSDPAEMWSSAGLAALAQRVAVLSSSAKWAWLFWMCVAGEGQVS